MERLTLDCINITNLFGRFTYHIDLRNGEDISVLIAPNGCGKTTIFSIVTFIFKPTYQSFKKVSLIPFNKCECILSNGNKVILESRAISNSSNSKRLSSNLRGTFHNQEDIDIILDHYESHRELTLIVGNKSISYSSIISKMFKDVDPDFLALMEENEIDDFKIDRLPASIRERTGSIGKLSTDIINTLKNADCFININFITADRLHSRSIITRSDRIRYRYGYEMPVADDPIKKAQKNLLDLMKQVHEEFSALQTKAKDELPKQYLEVSEPLWTFEEFKKYWTSYVSDIEKFYEIGLLDSAETILNIDNLEQYYTDKGSFLSVYLSAFSKTLEPLNKHYEKLKLFADIFNERNRITKKKIKYGKKGIILTVAGEELSLECLSSGEKNDFVMFYDLIFDSKDNGLVLIDEPEISLHIEWQKTFLDSLIDICRMNNLQSIVATHSPNIINGHRELFAERGIEYDGSEED